MGAPNRLGGGFVFERDAYWKEGAKSNHYGNNVESLNVIKS